MVLMTMIGRIPDGLPLAATMQEDEHVISLQIFKIVVKLSIFIYVYY